MDHTAEDADKVRRIVVDQVKRRRAQLPEWRRRESARMLDNVKTQHQLIMKSESDREPST